MTFDLHPWRFRFVAREPIRFAAGRQGNMLRGAFGAALKRVACVPECRDARTCPRRGECAYARLFEPVAAGRGAGPSGLADRPRPFVFRVRHLDGRTVRAGETFHVAVNVFDTHRLVPADFAGAFEEMARQGMGTGRGRASLEAVEVSDEPLRLVLDPAGEGVGRARVEFLSPTELKTENAIADRPVFGVLFARARDRVGTLAALYGAGAPAIDFAALGRRAERVVMTRCEIARVEIARRSAATGRTHSIGGFTGVAEYAGALDEFLPWLRAAAWTGVGRHTVWGNGEIRVTALP